jgi:hypothetical protein
MQRDRSFASYEDTEARYERRPERLGAAARRLGSGPGRAGAAVHARRDPRQRRRLLGAVAPARGRASRWTTPTSSPGRATPSSARPAPGPRNRAAAWATTARGGRHGAPARSSTWSTSPARHSTRWRPTTPRCEAVATADANGRVLEQQLAWFNPPAPAHLAPGAARAAARPGPAGGAARLPQHDNHTVSETWTNIERSTSPIEAGQRGRRRQRRNASADGPPFRRRSLLREERIRTRSRRRRSTAAPCPPTPWRGSGPAWATGFAARCSRAARLLAHAARRPAAAVAARGRRRRAVFLLHRTLSSVVATGLFANARPDYTTPG